MLIMWFKKNLFQNEIMNMHCFTVENYIKRNNTEITNRQQHRFNPEQLKSVVEKMWLQAEKSVIFPMFSTYLQLSTI